MLYLTICITGVPSRKALRKSWGKFFRVSHYNRESLEKVLEQNKRLDIKVVGKLVFADDIDEQLAIKTIKSLKVFG